LANVAVASYDHKGADGQGQTAIGDFLSPIQDFSAGVYTEKNLRVDGHAAFGNAATLDYLHPLLNSTSPISGVISIDETLTDTLVDDIGGLLVVVSAVPNASNYQGSYYGAWFVVDVPSSSHATGIVDAFGQLASVAFRGADIGTMEGVQGNTQNLGAGTVVRATGGEFKVIMNGAGSIGTADAVAAIVNIYDDVAPGTITDANGLHVYTPNVGGASVLTTAHGVRVDDQTAATTNYAIRTGLGGLLFGSKAALADAAIAASQFSLWLDDTNGAAKLMIKAKQADGTVKTAAIALS